MNYSELSQLSRSELIDAQQAAIMQCDNETLRRISNILTGFQNVPQNAVQRMTYLNDEVEDVEFAPESPSYDYRSHFHTFLTRAR